jgi:hypothetical protein
VTSQKAQTRSFDRWLSVTCALLLSVFAFVSFSAPAAMASNVTRVQLLSNDESSYRPTAGHLIVGGSIKLPPALFAANAPGSATLVTPSEARNTAVAMWTAWQIALDTNDTRALTQLAVPGPMLRGTIYNCAYPGDCLSGATQRPSLGGLEVVVPKQRTYPLYFLASVKTTNLVHNEDGLSQEGPWMDLQILTKASSAAPWQLSFDSGYNAPKGDALPWLGFDFEKNAASPPTGEYAANPTILSFVPTPQRSRCSKSSCAPPIKVSASSYISRLAAYWQSYKDTGHAPARDFFLTGGDSSGEGASLAESREGSIYAGSRNSYAFTFDPKAGSWRFAVGGGYTMVCGSVLDTAAQTPVSGLLYQDSDENNFGAPLETGSYFKIITAADHEVCIYPASGDIGKTASIGLSVAGNDVYTSDVTGRRAPDDLVDLSTGFGVLSSELAQYAKQYSTCTATTSRSCVKTLAQESSQEYATFDGVITADSFPAKYQSEVGALNTTARKLTGLYESVYEGKRTEQIVSSITTSEKKLVSDYNKLVKSLSSG